MQKRNRATRGELGSTVTEGVIKGRSSPQPEDRRWFHSAVTAWPLKSAP